MFDDVGDGTEGIAPEKVISTPPEDDEGLGIYPTLVLFEIDIDLCADIGSTLPKSTTRTSAAVGEIGTAFEAGLEVRKAHFLGKTFYPDGTIGETALVIGFERKGFLCMKVDIALI